MESFDKLFNIAHALHGPNGCPWDKKQTFKSLRSHILEEVHELLEAVDEDNIEGMVEELGDLFFFIIFYAKIGEKEGEFTLEEIITTVSEKLIRRHPHVFGEAKVKDADEVMHHWERIKKLEKKERKNVLEGIPKTLNILLRAQKIIEKMGRKEVPFPEKKEIKSTAEEVIGDQIIDLIIQSSQEGIDAESAVRVAIKKYEETFLAWEKNQQL